jgi:Ser-tRNA(Ala) deacylase AlaX
LVKDPPSNLADSAQAILHLEEETMRRKRLAKKSLGINSTSDLAQSDALVENRRKTRKKVVKSTNKKFEKSSTVLKCSDEFPVEEDLSKDDKITKVNSRKNTEKVSNRLRVVT